MTVKEGQRLACQAIIHGQGEVRVLSRAEELRRMVQGVLRPHQGEDRLSNLAPLLPTLEQQTGDQLALFPQNVFRNLRRVGLRRFAFPILDGKRLLRDVDSPGWSKALSGKSYPATTLTLPLRAWAIATD
jgi:hypothetical protein